MALVIWLLQIMSFWGLLKVQGQKVKEKISPIHSSTDTME
jgi:hypothetical protein